MTGGAAAGRAAPVFVGGTGRSGTTIVARLIGQHSRYTTVGAELKFHANRGGLADLVEGHTDLATFMNRLRERWYSSQRSDGSRRGFRAVCRAPQFERVAATFERDFPDEPVAAARRLLLGILNPYARRHGTPGWVEQTPTSAMVAGTLARLLPELKLVHVVRDGRDVAASLVRQRWGPAEPLAALDYWAWRLRRAYAGTAALTGDQLLVVGLERLVERGGAYEELLSFIGLDDEQVMRTFFSERMTVASAHVGRWRALPQAPALDESYRSLRRTLVAEGVLDDTLLPA